MYVVESRVSNLDIILLSLHFNVKAYAIRMISLCQQTVIWSPLSLMTTYKYMYGWAFFKTMKCFFALLVHPRIRVLGHHRIIDNASWFHLGYLLSIIGLFHVCLLSQYQYLLSVFFFFFIVFRSYFLHGLRIDNFSCWIASYWEKWNRSCQIFWVS